MHEKPTDKQHKEEIKFLEDRGVLSVYRNDKNVKIPFLSTDRICFCCGAGFIGTPTWSANMKLPGHLDEKVTWNLKNFVAFNFIKEDEWPTLDKDRMFIRLHGETMDAMISWEDT
jgi:hypothetical protein